MKSDIEIAQAATLKPILQVVLKLSLNNDDLIPYGQHIAKLSAACIQKLQNFHSMFGNLSFGHYEMKI